MDGGEARAVRRDKSEDRGEGSGRSLWKEGEAWDATEARTRELMDGPTVDGGWKRGLAVDRGESEG